MGHNLHFAVMALLAVALLVGVVPYTITLRRRVAFEHGNSKLLHQRDEQPTSGAGAGDAPSSSTPKSPAAAGAKLFRFAEPDTEGMASVEDVKGGPRHKVQCRLLSVARPRVMVCENFLTPDECESLIVLGSPALQKSGVGIDEKDSFGPNEKSARTSYGMRFPSSNALVKRIDRRVLSLTNMTGTFAERLYLLRYLKGQRYVEHTDGFGGVTGSLYAAARRQRYRDWLNKRSNGSKHRARMQGAATTSAVDGKHMPLPADGRAYTMLDRAASVLLYLRTMPLAGGGTTSFPLLDPSGAHVGPLRKQAKHAAGGAVVRAAAGENACNASLRLNIRPVQGRLLLFYSMTEEGVTDGRSLHAGCEVLGDTPKWSITKWLQVPLP